MLLLDPIKFQKSTLFIGDKVKDLLKVFPEQTVYAYPIKNKTLIISTELFSPRLYFLKTYLPNYQGALSDLTSELFSKFNVDIKKSDDVSLNNLAFSSLCLELPKGSDPFKIRGDIEDHLEQQFGITPFISFFLVAFFPFFPDIEKKARSLKIGKNYEITLDDQTVKDLDLNWKPEEATPVISAFLDAVPCMLFQFFAPEEKLMFGDLIISDKAGSFREILRALSKYIDLKASTSVTIRKGETARWIFYGVLTGSLDELEKELEKLKTRNLLVEKRELGSLTGK